MTGEPGKPIGFLAATSRYDSGKARTVWKTSRATAWMRARCGSRQAHGPGVPMLIQGNFVYVSAKSSLLALKQTDRHVAWQRR